ncbi:hypothetical protein Celal_0510 [Cellulophaga algicola DSM 14237]|uniref:Lipocalin-like domain-containing protein n=1 Tax=Cellulophaga algicola (strain DSM 14237 / IC166 / ACAM 630) TaxID=688270 RepID=E6XBL4_CELAD|nr:MULTISPECIES: hypothetical protein [Cellulophaga]ADV47849.1 hypothetical protein Celal_0510 [Cellulophaga algicola DSM 14237]
MKKHSPFIALCATLIFASCSKTTVNNDPVIGIWTSTVENNSVNQKTIKTESEWIFNDAYLGRYHQYENKDLTVQTDFSWKHEDDQYIISYPGTDFPDDIVTLVQTTLQESDGDILATREQ